MENTPPRRRNQGNYARNADNLRKKRKREKESRRNENGDGNLRGRQLVFSKVQQLEDTVNRLQQIQNEDKKDLLKQIEKLKDLLEQTVDYFHLQTAFRNVSDPNNLKY